MVEDGVRGQAEGAAAETSAAAEQGKDGGDGHRGELGRRRRREGVVTGETLVVGSGVAEQADRRMGGRTGGRTVGRGARSWVRQGVVVKR